MSAAASLRRRPARCTKAGLSLSLRLRCRMSHGQLINALEDHLHGLHLSDYFESEKDLKTEDLARHLPVFAKRALEVLKLFDPDTHTHRQGDRWSPPPFLTWNTQAKGDVMVVKHDIKSFNHGIVMPGTACWRLGADRAATRSKDFWPGGTFAHVSQGRTRPKDFSR